MGIHYKHKSIVRISKINEIDQELNKIPEIKPTIAENPNEGTPKSEFSNNFKVIGNE